MSPTVSLVEGQAVELAVGEPKRDAVVGPFVGQAQPWVMGPAVGDPEGVAAADPLVNPAEGDCRPHRRLSQRRHCTQSRLASLSLGRILHLLPLRFTLHLASQSTLIETRELYAEVGST